jgi:hypothetical protein
LEIHCASSQGDSPSSDICRFFCIALVASVVDSVALLDIAAITVRHSIILSIQVPHASAIRANVILTKQVGAKGIFPSYEMLRAVMGTSFPSADFGKASFSLGAAAGGSNAGVLQPHYIDPFGNLSAANIGRSTNPRSICCHLPPHRPFSGPCSYALEQ